MKRRAKSKHSCRRCPAFAPPAGCRDKTIRSGRCGDWVYYVRGGKLRRRRYVRPRDPSTLAQMRSRGRLSAISRNYSGSLTDAQQDACIAAGAKRRARPRLGYSGTLTGHQYWVHKEYRRKNMQSKVTKTRNAPQVPRSRPLTQSTWGTHRIPSRTTPAPRRLNGRRAGKQRARSGHIEHEPKKAAPSSQVLKHQTVTRSTGGRRRDGARVMTRRLADTSPVGVAPQSNVWYTPGVTRNTITIRLRRPKAEIEAAASPNVNAWVNQLIEQALRSPRADWRKRVDRPALAKKPHPTSKATRGE